MADWTDTAEREFETQLRRLKWRFAKLGLDEHRLVRRLREAIDEDAGERGMDTIGGDRMEEFFRDAAVRLGLMEAKVQLRGRTFVLWFGVVLPAIAILVEVLCRPCASTVFDPFPTVMHGVLVVLVPCANLLIWWVSARWSDRSVVKLTVANGLAIGVAFVYGLIYLPFSPLAVIAILFCGLGLLPLAPIFALAAALLCFRYLRRVAIASNRAYLGAAGGGFAAGIVVLCALEGRFTATHLGVRMVVSDSVEHRRNGIRLLRTLGDDDYLLRMCYVRQHRATDIGSFLLASAGGGDTADARLAYYRLTGRPFNEVEPPPLFRGRRSRGRAFDEALGGLTVGGKVEGLSLHSSRMDGSIDADAALAYLEWTLEFVNSSSWQREVRAQVWLPPDGVVSRLTLWVDGQEREAAFAARGKVREAYERVVQRRRDPVLVTTSGPDRVQVQCFPVPPNGEMKIRLGITAPLVLASKAQGTLHLPQFIETNFVTPADVQHAIWMESKSPLRPSVPSITAENPKPSLYAARGEATVGQVGVFVTAGRAAEALNCWTTDPIGKDTHVVTQTIEPVAVRAPSRVVIVVDGSAGMAAVASRVAETLTALPEGIEFAAILASDAPVELAEPQRGTADLYRQVSEAFGSRDFVGGRDNVPALELAWDLVAQSQDGVIVWVHGAVPVELSPASGLRQRWERRPDRVRMFDAQVAPGANVIARKLDGLPQIESCRDLKALFRAWDGQQTKWSFKRRRVAKQEAEAFMGERKQTSAHLARLWAYEQVLQDAPQGRLDAAIKLAASYHLVTPVTGAVVLETQRQFEEAGLEPAEADSVPSIPEPEMVLLMVLAAVVLLWAWWRRRVTCGAA